MTPENDANLSEADLSSDYNHKVCNSCVEETDYDWSDPKMCEISDAIEPFREEFDKLWCDEDAPKCAEEGCENHAAKNEFYPNGDPPNTEYWTLCDECFKKDQGEEDSDNDE
jgi:hypothetical protein